MNIYKIESNLAQLYVTVEGEGKPLIMIHGGGGDASSYPMPQSFKSGKKIVCYDRRAHSRSTGDKFSYSMDDQTDDIIAIMDKLDIKKADFFGSSSGGVIGLAFLNKYPDRINKIVIHEATISNGEVWKEFKEVLYKLSDEYLISKQEAFMNFSKRTGLLDQMKMPIEEGGISNIEREFDNSDYFILQEVKYLSTFNLDFNEMIKYKDKLILGIGEYSTNSLPYRAVKEVSEYLKIVPRVFPGGHTGTITHLNSFYKELDKLL